MTLYQAADELIRAKARIRTLETQLQNQAREILMLKGALLHARDALEVPAVTRIFDLRVQMDSREAVREINQLL